MLFFLLALLALLQSATYLLVRHANRQHALAQIESSLQTGAQVFEKLIERRNQQITFHRSNSFPRSRLSGNFCRRGAGSSDDVIGLESLQGRVKADAVLIASLDKQLLFDMGRPELHGIPFPFPKLIDRAESNDPPRLTRLFFLITSFTPWRPPPSRA